MISVNDLNSGGQLLISLNLIGIYFKCGGNMAHGSFRPLHVLYWVPFPFGPFLIYAFCGMTNLG